MKVAAVNSRDTEGGIQHTGHRIVLYGHGQLLTTQDIRGPKKMGSSF